MWTPTIAVVVVGTFEAAHVRPIGISGSVAVLANAIYHVAGKRIRDPPITPDKLL